MLRHDPARAGLELDAGGWVEVDALLAGLARLGHPLTHGELERVVAGNDKQRFALDAERDRIRANQGHSVPVDLGLDPEVPPDRLWHGTSVGAVSAILRAGLHPAGRHAVHLSSDRQTAARVGSRRGRHAVLEVDTAAMHSAGHEFTRSANGVWLVAEVPPAYLRLLA